MTVRNLFVCDGCGKTASKEGDEYPDGWRYAAFGEGGNCIAGDMCKPCRDSASQAAVEALRLRARPPAPEHISPPAPEHELAITPAARAYVRCVQLAHVEQLRQRASTLQGLAVETYLATEGLDLRGGSRIEWVIGSGWRVRSPGSERKSSREEVYVLINHEALIQGKIK
jgi:hypothetical protein